MNRNAPAWRARVEEFGVVVDATLALGRPDLALVEIVPDTAAQRAIDLRLVRAALDEGASPADLGALFLTVATNFAYEVDWGDQFRFWPMMNEHLGSGALAVSDDGARRQVERAFREFSERWRGVSPTGDLLLRFPFMGWPLIHAVLPWCAQRHVARVYERAGDLGLLPEGPDDVWRDADLTILAEDMRAPVFVQGLLASRSVNARIARALLWPEHGGGAPSWIKRLAGRVRGDAPSRGSFEAARSEQRSRAAARRSPAASLPISLALADNGLAREVQVYACMGPYSESVATAPEVRAFAAAGARLYATVGGKRDSGRSAHLFNALTAPALMELSLPMGAIELAAQAQPYEGAEIPPAITRAHEGAPRMFEPPLLFTGDEGGRFSLHEGGALASVTVAAVVVRGSSLDIGLRATLAPRAVRGSPRLLAYVGRVTPSALAALTGSGIKIDEPPPRLVPALIAPMRRGSGRLFYEAGRDVWLGLRDGPPGVSLMAEVMRDGVATALELGVTDAGAILVRAPTELLLPGAQTVRVIPQGRARAIASVEVFVVPAARPAARQERWRLALRPSEATRQHLLEGQCWLEVESLPDVAVEIQLRAGDRVASFTLAEAGERRMVATSRALSAAVSRLDLGTGDGSPPIELLARAADEPEVWRQIAMIGPSASPVRFDLRGAAPAVSSSDASATLCRIEFSPEGVRARKLAAQASLEQPGVYLAEAGASRAALVVTADGRLTKLTEPPVKIARELARTRELAAALRAVEIAETWPPRRSGASLLRRREAARAIEDELRRALCGDAWSRLELRLAAEDADRELAIRELARALWMPPSALGNIADSEDPLEIIDGLCESLGERDVREARDLTLFFFRRGMASPSRDGEALRWGWSSVRRARAACAAALLADTERFSSSGDDN